MITHVVIPNMKMDDKLKEKHKAPSGSGGISLACFYLKNGVYLSSTVPKTCTIDVKAVLVSRNGLTPY